ncbi:MAG: hypothetical protein K6C36_01925 [Clostridia bacterium]|nr:hypothetical protein [Clostridia bacterium]
MSFTKRDRKRGFRRDAARLSRCIAAFVCFALVLTSCSGGSNEPVEEPSEAVTEAVRNMPAELRLPYNADDGLNPFAVESSMNSVLMPLMYEGLFSVSADYTPAPVLAQRASVSDYAMTVTLAPRSFSDGTAVTARDVVYSFEQAASSPLYKNRLARISAARSSGADVVFDLESPNFFSVALLDFPVVKSGTAQDRTSVPVGTGRFVPSGPDTLVSRGDGEVKEIRLYNIFDGSTLDTNLELGHIDLYYTDLSDGTGANTSFSVYSRDVNSLVYLGFNPNINSLSDPALRRALSTACDRASVAGSAFQGYARPALAVLNPAYAGSGEAVWDEAARPADAYDLIAAAGYASPADIDEPGVTAKTELSYRLITPEGNRFKSDCAENLRRSFAAAGVELTVTELGSEAFAQYLEAGWYDLYLGEVRLNKDQDLTQLFSGRSATVLPETECAGVYDSYLRHEVGIEEFNSAFYADVPFIPLVYRCGAVVCAEGVRPGSGSASDLFAAVS